VKSCVKFVRVFLDLPALLVDNGLNLKQLRADQGLREATTQHQIIIFYFT